MARAYVRIGVPRGTIAVMDLSTALTTYDRVSLNLDKLDRVWQQMWELSRACESKSDDHPDAIAYAQLRVSWMEIAASLPSIDGWRLQAEPLEWNAMARERMRFKQDEAGSQLASLLLDKRSEVERAPESEALKYRQKVTYARQRLVRRRGEELVKVIDDLLASVAAKLDINTPAQELNEQIPESEVETTINALREPINEIERLIGDALSGGPRHGDLHRHLHFGMAHDLRDILVHDWPAFRPHLELALYGNEAPVPIDVSDLSTLASATVVPVPSHVQWDRIDADGFERLLMRLLEMSASYFDITRPMNVNAADGGRDIQAYRRVGDGLTAERIERVMVQAKHWQKGIPVEEISNLVHAKLPLWEGEPVRVLIVATTGSFTQDAVRWTDDHNRQAKRPEIVLWSSSELEALLRKWSALLAEFGLID